ERPAARVCTFTFDVSRASGSSSRTRGSGMQGEEMRAEDRPIGVFDSGVGGLTVVREMFRQLPEESVLYVGDTARVPYGPRGAETVTRFALELVQFLLDRDVKALLVACNSISAVAIDAIRALSPVPVIDVIAPT